MEARIAGALVGYPGRLVSDHLRQGSGRAYIGSGNVSQGRWNETTLSAQLRDEEIVPALQARSTP